MMISFTLQTLAVLGVLFISIFTVDKLKAISLPAPLPPLPRAPKAIQIVASQRITPASASNASIPVRPFVVPARIPQGIANIQDSPEMMAQAPALGGFAGAGPAGVEGGPGVAAPVVATPPPPPVVVKRPTSIPNKPILIGGKVMEAKMLRRVMPVYPPLARQARISGTVRLEGIISREGRVINLQVISGHPLLIQAALEAVRQWIYQPTLLNDQPVEVIAPIEVHFTLSQ